MENWKSKKESFEHLEIIMNIPLIISPPVRHQPVSHAILAFSHLQAMSHILKVHRLKKKKNQHENALIGLGRFFQLLRMGKNTSLHFSQESCLPLP